VRKKDFEEQKHALQEKFACFNVRQEMYR